MNRARSRRRGKKLQKIERILSSLKKRKSYDDITYLRIYPDHSRDEHLWAGWINEELSIAVLLNHPLDWRYRWGDIVSVQKITSIKYGHKSEYKVIKSLLKRFD